MLNKWTITISGVAAAVFFALVAQAQSVAYIAKGAPVLLDAACKTKLGAAVQSVYPQAQLANVESWGCVRHLASQTLAVNCRGTYELTTTVSQWKAAQVAAGGESFRVKDVSGGNVTYVRNVASQTLGSADLAEHMTFAGDCLPAQVSDIFSFVCLRNDAEVVCETDYATTAADDATLADLYRQGKVLQILQP